MKQPHKIDWQAARAALERAQARLERAGFSASDRERIFRERAEALARPPAAPADGAQQRQIIVFWLGEERAALPLSDVTEVISGATVAPVPGAPPEVAGVLQVRGEIRPVFDLMRLTGAASLDGLNTVALVRYRNGEAGLRIGSVEDIRFVSGGNLREAAAGNQGIRHMTEDLIPILNLEYLLNGYGDEIASFE